MDFHIFCYTGRTLFYIKFNPNCWTILSISVIKYTVYPAKSIFMPEVCVVLNLLSCVNLWTPEGRHILSVFIPVFIDNMTVVFFTHRHLGLKGCHVTWVTTICVCVEV